MTIEAIEMRVGLWVSDNTRNAYGPSGGISIMAGPETPDTSHFRRHPKTRSVRIHNADERAKNAVTGKTYMEDWEELGSM